MSYFETVHPVPTSVTPVTKSAIYCEPEQTLGGRTGRMAKDILAIVAYTLIILHYSVKSWPKGKSPGSLLATLSKALDPNRLKYPLSKAFKALSRRFFLSGYLVRNEIMPIVGMALLMNSSGVLLSGSFKNVLFLDMTGTAFCAYLLGPWYGALSGLLSNSFVNYVMYPGNNAERIIFPWSLVNMAGGFFWGYLAGRPAFKKYMRGAESPLGSHLLFLLLFGVVASLVMSIPGAFVQTVVGDDVMMQNSNVALAIRSFADRYCHEGASWKLLCRWVTQTFWSIPDKAISAAIAIVAVRLGFPLYERELIHGNPSRPFPRDGWLGVILLTAAYVPSVIVFSTWDLYHFKEFLILWLSPGLFILVRAIRLGFFKPVPRSVLEDQKARTATYENVLKVVSNRTAYAFYERLKMVTLLSTLILMLSLPILGVSFYQVAGNFLLVVGGFLFAVYALRIAIGQNTLAPESVSSVSEIHEEAALKAIGASDSSERGGLSEVVLPGFKLLRRGKVRHIYRMADSLLIVASDRIPVFDRELATPIPGKGIVLTKLSAFWFQTLNSASPHHFITNDASGIEWGPLELPMNYSDRITLVRELDMIPFECIVRGYLVGRAWEEYRKGGAVFGQMLPKGLHEGARLPELIFTPTRKQGEWRQQDVTIDAMCAELQYTRTERLRDWSFMLFKEASAWCEQRGLILCDSKFEFGVARASDGSEDLVLADEILTPDSSRFLQVQEYAKDRSLQPWDRQLVENYLADVGWNPIDPPPTIPAKIVDETAKRYRLILDQITGPPLGINDTERRNVNGR